MQKNKGKTIFSDIFFDYFSDMVIRILGFYVLMPGESDEINIPLVSSHGHGT